MRYILNSKLRDQKILSEILQNRFANFDNSCVKWKFNNKNINCAELEEKLINTYNNKIQFPKKNNKITYTDWIEIFDEGLLNLKSTNRKPILFFSGGKDSTFIASRMQKNNINGLFYSFVKDNNEKKIILDLADKLNIKIFFADHSLKYLNFEDIFKKIREPVLDPAGLSVLLLLDINLKNKINFKDTVFIDGMGNDAYMGHLPGKRELQKMFFQKFFTKLNFHKLISIKNINKLGKYGDLFRPNYMAHFPGSNIKLNNYYDQINFYQKYTNYNNVVLQRALQRGIHYDFGCAINKSILYADACDENSNVFFPFLNENLIDYYEKREFMDYDYSKLLNKLSLRKYLNDKLNFNKISPTKSIFKPTFLKIKFDIKQTELSKKIGINIDSLNKFQRSDFFLWSKYLINNEIKYDIN
jgi:asparagine synthase (glutamine-hydrolysing)